MFKVGLIGCGAISRGQIRGLKTIDDVAITCVCDLSDANLKEACDSTGAKPYKDYKEMVKAEDLDLVLISLPHALHKEATCFCAEQGVDIFLEKPMGISSDDCQAMIDAAEKAGVMLWVGHPLAYSPQLIYAKKLIDSGELGEMIGFYETRNLEYFTPTRPKWFGIKAMSGGGIGFNLGAHFMDKLKYLSGSNIAQAVGGVHMHEGLDCEDSIQAFVKTESGVCGSMNLIGCTTQVRYEQVIYLTNGEIRMRLWDGPFVEYAKKGEELKRHDLSDVVPEMTAQMQDVIATLRSGEKKPKVDGYYGKDIVHAIKCIYGDEK